MPSWVTLIIERDELDLNPPAGGGQYPQPSTEKLGETLDQHVMKARESLSKTNDEFLRWRALKLWRGHRVVRADPGRTHVILGRCLDVFGR